MSSGVVCQEPDRTKSSSKISVLPKPRHKISPRCQCIECKRLIQGYFQASEAVRRQGAYVCLTAARCFNSSGRTNKPQHLNQKEKSTLLLKSLLLQLPATTCVTLIRHMSAAGAFVGEKKYNGLHE